jgi:hypothetical protein
LVKLIQRFLLINEFNFVIQDFGFLCATWDSYSDFLIFPSLDFEIVSFTF